jgi:anti-sigma B factor antagonist
MDEHPDQLTTETMMTGNCAVISVVGELDSVTSEALTSAAQDAVDHGATELVLDLSGVEFMDSSGISALISTRTIASITLRHPSPAVTRLVDITGLSDVFAIEP